MTLMLISLGYRLGKFLVLSAIAPAVVAQPFPHSADVVRTENLSHNVKRITLRVRAPYTFTFQPGQYLFVRVPDAYVRTWNQRYGTSHGEVSRPYSLASSPSRLPLFDLIIKHQKAPPGKDVPPGLASTYVHTALRTGDIVRFSEAVGSLFTPRSDGGPYILVAGGAGISPFVGLLKYWFERGEDKRRKIYLYLGVRSRKDLLLHETFSDWAATKRNFSYVAALSHQEAGDAWKGETGYINAVLDRHFPAPLDAEVYIAGPPVMVRETVKVARAKGLSPERIHHDPIPTR